MFVLSANNQHYLDAEISESLTETSFYRALGLAVGTVSVIDRDGVCWTRIWYDFAANDNIFIMYHVHGVVLPGASLSLMNL